MDVLNIRRHIVCHRGLWTSREDQNSPSALIAALEEGFGLETDIRDSDGDLVIEHDPPLDSRIRFAAEVKLWQEVGLLENRVLALNIKSDGLAIYLQELVETLGNCEYFYFDMSFPQLRQFSQLGLPIALRVSEYEPLSLEALSLLGERVHLWVDSFESDWWLERRHLDFLVQQHPATLVSPEIHGRDPEHVWKWFAMAIKSGHDVSLVTDCPFEVERACRR